MKKVILFDGVCNFCDRSVQFIIKRDHQAVFQFASLQSESGQKLLKKHGVPEDTDSFIFVDGEKYYDRSSAALHVFKHLPGGWKLLYGLIVLPKPIRDAFYQLIAKNRYKWFGRKESCMLPTPDERKRFLD
ncbi:thiol-disulfide oxidoreductase DCC family protein [Cytobacillus horneckiae]|uniref:Thiol-disulfide oxidoreductase DCC family protein n=1 Tax=Cytobacillus horneckiae TaxID=549687 RepID=A0A2N0ZEZ1_9BACI|nr:thiol-disulfide oxidoreductase DCC family protein [Cytobacillus horneckiae]NRG47585.1 thiol-disulfide oxidoreductase DCC family protein [Bacillus sp. CRN 9]MCM3176820.1 thiol-disulfide oxidoreductase DCC family protein [Cytobacillus horneckiae]MEC1156662.1 thiol-disulfide oxidoreductase DCC family protein [Cytobacillus horneckiae]MED2939117.1 thiol-disulfide oxidoreductase DCC family protein [Cytobacillus horneckiae]PKG28057.1 thiol-disulfide oxidoreductase DCC family protein [Cytobacillus 